MKLSITTFRDVLKSDERVAHVVLGRVERGICALCLLMERLLFEAKEKGRKVELLAVYTTHRELACEARAAYNQCRVEAKEAFRLFESGDSGRAVCAVPPFTRLTVTYPNREAGFCSHGL